METLENPAGNIELNIARSATTPNLFKRLVSQIKEVAAYRKVLRQLVITQLVLRYRRTALGYAWTLINPLIMMTITSVVFSQLFKMDLKTYAVVLFAGMIPWNCFSSIVIQSSVAFITNENLIKKIYLPRAIFPMSAAISVMIDSSLAFISLFFIIVAIGGKVTLYLAYIPFAFFILFVFSMGIGFMMAVATVFFRDLQYILQITMQAWFYVTPILYKSEALTGKGAWLVQLNPMVPYIELFRAPLCYGVAPSADIILKAVIFALISLTIGSLLFIAQEKKIVFRL